MAPNQATNPPNVGWSGTHRLDIVGATTGACESIPCIPTFHTTAASAVSLNMVEFLTELFTLRWPTFSLLLGLFCIISAHSYGRSKNIAVFIIAFAVLVIYCLFFAEMPWGFLQIISVALVSVYFFWVGKPNRISQV